MGAETKFLLSLGAALAIVIAIRILASQDHIVGRICRRYWNISFKIAAFIPFCGWMAHLIIGKDKEIYVRIGQQTDQFASNMVEAAAERERREREREERVRREIAQQFGGNSVSLNSDGSAATYQDKQGNTHEVNVYYR